jgi:GAF domain-containing protein
MVVPIRSHGATLGSLGVVHRSAARPPSSQVRVLESLGRQLGRSLQIVRAREARRKARSETKFLRDITAALSTNLELRAVLDMVTVAAVRLTRSDGAVVLLLSSDRKEFQIASVSPYDSRYDIPNAPPAAGSLSNSCRIPLQPRAAYRLPLFRELQQVAKCAVS